MFHQSLYSIDAQIYRCYLNLESIKANYCLILRLGNRTSEQTTKKHPFNEALIEFNQKLNLIITKKELENAHKCQIILFKYQPGSQKQILAIASVHVNDLHRKQKRKLRLINNYDKCALIELKIFVDEFKGYDQKKFRQRWILQNRNWIERFQIQVPQPDNNKEHKNSAQEQQLSNYNYNNTRQHSSEKSETKTCPQMRIYNSIVLRDQQPRFNRKKQNSQVGRSYNKYEINKSQDKLNFYSKTGFLSYPSQQLSLNIPRMQKQVRFHKIQKSKLSSHKTQYEQLNKLANIKFKQHTDMSNQNLALQQKPYLQFLGSYNKKTKQILSINQCISIIVNQSKNKKSNKIVPAVFDFWIKNQYKKQKILIQREANTDKLITTQTAIQTQKETKTLVSTQANTIIINYASQMIQTDKKQYIHQSTDCHKLSQISQNSTQTDEVTKKQKSVTNIPSHEKFDELNHINQLIISEQSLQLSHIKKDSGNGFDIQIPELKQMKITEEAGVQTQMISDINFVLSDLKNKKTQSNTIVQNRQIILQQQDNKEDKKELVVSQLSSPIQRLQYQPQQYSSKGLNQKNKRKNRNKSFIQSQQLKGNDKNYSQLKLQIQSNLQNTQNNISQSNINNQNYSTNQKNHILYQQQQQKNSRNQQIQFTQNIQVPKLYYIKNNKNHQQQNKTPSFNMLQTFSKDNKMSHNSAGLFYSFSKNLNSSKLFLQSENQQSIDKYRKMSESFQASKPQQHSSKNRIHTSQIKQHRQGDLKHKYIKLQEVSNLGKSDLLRQQFLQQTSKFNFLQKNSKKLNIKTVLNMRIKCSKPKPLNQFSERRVPFSQIKSQQSKLMHKKIGYVSKQTSFISQKDSIQPFSIKINPTIQQMQNQSYHHTNTDRFTPRTNEKDEVSIINILCPEKQCQKEYHFKNQEQFDQSQQYIQEDAQTCSEFSSDTDDENQQKHSNRTDMKSQKKDKKIKNCFDLYDATKAIKNSTTEMSLRFQIIQKQLKQKQAECNLNKQMKEKFQKLSIQNKFCLQQLNKIKIQKQSLQKQKISLEQVLKQHQQNIQKLKTQNTKITKCFKQLKKEYCLLEQQQYQKSHQQKVDIHKTASIHKQQSIQKSIKKPPSEIQKTSQVQMTNKLTKKSIRRPSIDSKMSELVISQNYANDTQPILSKTSLVQMNFSKSFFEGRLKTKKQTSQTPSNKSFIKKQASQTPSNKSLIKTPGMSRIFKNSQLSSANNSRYFKQTSMEIQDFITNQKLTS